MDLETIESKINRAINNCPNEFNYGTARPWGRTRMSARARFAYEDAYKNWYKLRSEVVREIGQLEEEDFRKLSQNSFNNFLLELSGSEFSLIGEWSEEYLTLAGRPLSFCLASQLARSRDCNENLPDIFKALPAEVVEKYGGVVLASAMIGCFRGRSPILGAASASPEKFGVLEKELLLEAIAYEPRVAFYAFDDVVLPKEHFGEYKDLYRRIHLGSREACTQTLLFFDPMQIDSSNEKFLEEIADVARRGRKFFRVPHMTFSRVGKVFRYHYEVVDEVRRFVRADDNVYSLLNKGLAGKYVVDKAFRGEAIREFEGDRFRGFVDTIIDSVGIMEVLEDAVASEFYWKRSLGDKVDYIIERAKSCAEERYEARFGGKK